MAMTKGTYLKTDQERLPLVFDIERLEYLCSRFIVNHQPQCSTVRVQTFLGLTELLQLIEGNWDSVKNPPQ